MTERDAGCGTGDAKEREALGNAGTVGGGAGSDDDTRLRDVAETGGHEMSRREAVGMLAVLPFGLALPWASGPATAGPPSSAAHIASRIPHPASPRFFTPHEWQTVRVLVDLIIPRDERSGSATDAGVPEFMDFMMIDRPDNQTRIRGGLAWMDAECERRFGKTFVECGDAERTALLDDIAWPERATPGMSQGVAFFSRFRDLTASGFWSSKLGVDDLRYEGNTYVREWTGCPEAALRKLGVHY